MNTICTVSPPKTIETHTFASMLFCKGVDAKTVSELLGHSSVAFTMNIYVHLIEEQKSNAVNLIDDL